MSTLLKEYISENDVSIMLNIVNDINQICKTLKSDNIYTMKNGICYAYKSDPSDIIHQKVSFDFSSNRNRKAYNDDIKYINGILNGKKLFDWFKEYKKYVNKIELYDDHFVIYTSNNISCISRYLDERNLNFDYNPFNNYLNKINFDKRKKDVYHNDHFEVILEDCNVMNLKYPYEQEFLYKIKKKSGEIVQKKIRFRITKKIFPTYKKESNIDFLIYPINSANKMYEVVYEIKNKMSCITNYVTIINY